MPEHFPLYRKPSDEPAKTILFTNARVFDGENDKLSDPTNVLVEGKLISGLGDDVKLPESYEGKAATVDCGGKVLMPGLIDMHSHLAIQEGCYEGRDSFDQMAMGAMTGQDLMDYLQQGFTTVRDAGGNVLSIAKAVNMGRIPGPRIFACGAFLSQTGGHGDFGCCFQGIGSGWTNVLHSNSFTHIVDGRSEILRGARNNIRNGATQLKIMAGGGVASTCDPIHMTQFTFDEMKAAVEIAEDYGTYVMAHAYHDNSINRCIDAGVRCIEHGFLMSEATMKRMKENNIALSLQCVMSLEAFAAPEKITFFDADQKKKASQVYAGAQNMMELARKYEPLIVSGGDMFGHAFQHRQADNIIAMVTMGGFTPLTALKSATGNCGELLKWSTGLIPYKEGDIGVLKPGAYADIILVDGNPLEDITTLRRDNIKVVLKDGVCYKYNLPDGYLEVARPELQRQAEFRAPKM